MKKKGMEISINFLVMIVISLVIFIFAITFAFRFFGSAEKYRQQVDENTRKEIENIMINQGYKVAAYPTQIELYPGKDDIIGLGVFSVNFDSNETFELNVSCTKYIKTDGTAGGDGNCSKITILYTPKTVDIKPNSDYVYAVYIKNNAAQRGTYILNARVVAEGSQYGDVQKIYVKSV
jgi:hypothetical protein